MRIIFEVDVNLFGKKSSNISLQEFGKYITSLFEIRSDPYASISTMYSIHGDYIWLMHSLRNPVLSRYRDSFTKAIKPIVIPIEIAIWAAFSLRSYGDGLNAVLVEWKAVGRPRSWDRVETFSYGHRLRSIRSRLDWDKLRV